MTGTFEKIEDIEIEGAPAQPGKWLLWSLGRIRGGSTSEFSLQIFCKFLPLNEKDFYHFAGAVNGWIDVGVLPFVSRGTVFQNRKVSGLWKHLELKSFSCLPDGQRLCRMGQGGHLVPISPVEPVDYPAALAEVPVIIQDPNTGDPSDTLAALRFPSTEIGRFFLCQSSHMSHSMFFSPESNVSLNPIVNLDLSKWLDQDTYRIAPGRAHASAGHAEALAVVMTAPDLRELWAECTRHYLADRSAIQVQSKKNWTTILRCQLPMMSQNITVLGRTRHRPHLASHEKSEGPSISVGFDFDVFRIVEDFRALPFKNLEILSWTSQKSEDGNPDEDNDFDIPPRVTFSSRGGGHQRKRNTVTSGGTAASQTGSQVLKIDALGKKFPALSEVEVSRKIKSFDSLISNTKADVIELDALTTGERGSQGDDQHLNIVPTSPLVKDLPDTKIPEKRAIPTREVFKEFATSKLSSVSISEDELPIPLKAALSVSALIPNTVLESVGFQEDIEDELTLLELNMKWGPAAYHGRKVSSRKVMVSGIRTRFGHVTLFELEAKLERLTFLCVLAKRDLTALSPTEVASVLKAWSFRVTEDAASGFVWPTHYDFKEVVGFQLKHTKYRKASPKNMAYVVGAAIENIEKICFKTQ